MLFGSRISDDSLRVWTEHFFAAQKKKLEAASKLPVWAASGET